MKQLICILLLLFALSCSSSNDFNKGKEQLENMGYADIKNSGHVWFCCGKDDRYSTGFECKNKNGKIVKGCFCSSLGKSITIRFE